MKYVKKRYEKLLHELKKERGLDKDGQPLIPLYTRQVNETKDYALSLFGSMDKDMKVTMQKSAWARLFLKFKNWMLAKKSNYWTKPHDSFTKGAELWIEDETHPDGGYYEFSSQTFEGIIQTLQRTAHAINSIYFGKDKSFKNMKEYWGTLNSHQRENLRRLLSDLFLSLILTMVLSHIMSDDKIKDSESGSLMLNAVLNATTDLNIFMLTTSFLDGNTIALFSFMRRAITSATQSVVNLATGDFEASGKYATNTIKQMGSVKSFASFVE